MHKEGLSQDFLHEALKETQHRLFGEWGLIGEKGSNDDYANACSVYIFGQFYGRPGLDLKTRGFMVLSALCVLLRENVIPTWANACLNLGWTEEQLKELGALVSHVGGFPTSRGSLMIFDSVFEKRRGLAGEGGSASAAKAAPIPPTSGLYAKAKELAIQLFGTASGDLSDLPVSPDDDLSKELVTWVFGYLFGVRSLVPVKTKVLSIIAMSAAIGQNDMVRRWLVAARNSGATRTEVQEVIVNTAIYGGWPAAREALGILALHWPAQE
jgi:4-carboxymuconolactone decarboxylase